MAATKRLQSVSLNWINLLSQCHWHHRLHQRSLHLRVNKTSPDPFRGKCVKQSMSVCLWRRPTEIWSAQVAAILCSNLSRRLALMPNRRAACRGFGNDTTDCSKLVYISIYPRIIMSSSHSICLIHGKAGMSGAERVYICHMNCICSVFTQLMSLQSSCAEETVYGRLK